MVVSVVNEIFSRQQSHIKWPNSQYLSEDVLGKYYVDRSKIIPPLSVYQFTDYSDLKLRFHYLHPYGHVFSLERGHHLTSEKLNYCYLFYSFIYFSYIFLFLCCLFKIQANTDKIYNQFVHLDNLPEDGLQYVLCVGLQFGKVDHHVFMSNKKKVTRSLLFQLYILQRM